MDSKTKASTELLCFDKNDFMKPTFSVDEFLHKNRNVPSLELLRDNLGLYLKDLRASMIDLINADYADFVNLAANLVGLDQSIEHIKKPLEEFRNEIDGIYQLIKENENEMRENLEEKQKIRIYKRNVQSLKKVAEAVQKLEGLLANQLCDSLKPVDLERAALELIQLKFNVQFCNEYLKEEDKFKIKELEDKVHEKIRKLFNDSLKTASSTSSESLERCLRIYVTLDACRTAENVFRDDIVAPYMSNVISEHNLQNTPQGLAGIYIKILNFISLHMTDILRLTQYTDKLRGFNFLVNSFWADVEMRLETHMSSIFAPGNSEIFFFKYRSTQEFLTKMEELLANEQTIEEFRKHKQTKSFQSRWNLPVYFQICFQEIAGQFEGVLEPLLRADILGEPSDSDFQIITFRYAYTAFERCWSDGVFLDEVYPKFYKLSIQIILRLSHWIEDVISLVINEKKSLEKFPENFNKTVVLIALHADIQKMIFNLPKMEENAVKHIPKSKMNNNNILNETILKSFTNVQDILFANLVKIQDTLVEQLVGESSLENIRQVNDLPRLYRKTNRDVPTRSSLYVEQMVRPLKTFSLEQSKHLGQDIVEDILGRACSRITIEYHSAVVEVLTSVQKTEESLRRLKNLKSGSSSTSISASTNSPSITDDDKIRLQLRVDVAAWTSELAHLNFMSSQIDKLLDLNKIVEDSIKLRENTN